MSTLRKSNDTEKTRVMLDLIRDKYPSTGMSLSHIVIEEVAPGVGFYGASRFADALALGVWKSEGQTLAGYEVKASRADLKKELADPSKHAAVARYCTSWTLVAWDEGVLVDGIPDSWGILLTRPTSFEGRELYPHRKAAPRIAEEWPREFVCSLIRNAYQQAPSGAAIGHACEAVARRTMKDAEQLTKSRMSSTLHPLAVALYGPDSWKWPKEATDPSHVVAVAIERLAQLPLAREFA